jgi:uncharacterized protein (TIGR03435 family)
MWPVALVVALSGPIAAQTIEVAAIRENPNSVVVPNGAFVPKAVEFQRGRLRIAYYTIEDLVAFAYGVMSPLVRDKLIVGWPKTGIKDKGFDISANLTREDDLSLLEQQTVLRELLTTRFAFKAHVEKRTLDVDRLELVKPGQLGPGLRRVDFNCATLAPADYPKDKEGSLCGFARFENRRFFRRQSGELSALVRELNVMRSERVIVDGTGLSGRFVWDLRYSGSTLLSDLREQLGLKLMPAKAPVDVVVIDDVRMPTPN